VPKASPKFYLGMQIVVFRKPDGYSFEEHINLLTGIITVIEFLVKNYLPRIFYETVFIFLMFIVPIILVTFFRPGLVMIILGSISFLIGLNYSILIDCYVFKDLKSCYDESLEIGPISAFLVIGVFYSSTFLVPAVNVGNNCARFLKTCRYVLD
jgi:hypothetical protein